MKYVENYIIIMKTVLTSLQDAVMMLIAQIFEGTNNLKEQAKENFASPPAYTILDKNFFFL